MQKHAHPFGRLAGLLITAACTVSCSKESGGLAAVVVDSGGANIVAQKLTSTDVVGRAGFDEISSLTRRDITTKDTDENPTCARFDLTVCGKDFEKRDYKAVPFRSGLREECEEGTAWIEVSESNSACNGASREWASASGSIEVESVVDGEVHARFDVAMQVKPDVFLNEAEGVFRVEGTMWTDHVERPE